MDTLLQIVAGGLILGVLGGLYRIAYHHPEAYSKLGYTLLWLTSAAIWGVLVWNVAVAMAAKAAIVATDYKSTEAIYAATNQLIPSFLWTFAPAGGFTFYLSFLRLLPVLGITVNARKP